MRVAVKAFAMLPGKLGNRCPDLLPTGFHAGMPFLVELTAGAVVNDVLSELKLEEGEVLNVFVNGRSVTLETPLSDRDELGLFPPVGGG